MMCEKDGFIPRFYVDKPQDKVDYVIRDMQDYTRTLITEEMHLGSLIEKAVQQIEDERLKEIENEVDEIDEEDAFERELFADHLVEELSDEDFEDFKLFEDEVMDENEKLFDQLFNGEDDF